MIYKFVLILALVAFANAQRAVGIRSNATGSCGGSGCNWSNNLAIFTYDDGTPLPGDYLTIRDPSITEFVLNFDIDATFGKLDVGYDDKPANKYTINVKSGVTLQVGTIDSDPSGEAFFHASTSVNVEAGATLLVGGKVEVGGMFGLGGTMRLYGSGGSPGLKVEGQTYITPSNPTIYNKYPIFTLNGGHLISPQQARFTDTATLTGTGNITSEVIMEGKLLPGADDTVPANMYIAGSLRLQNSAKTTFNFKNKDEFDHIYITNSLTTNGDLLLSPIGDFEPLNGQRFYIMNHTELIGGFDNVRGDGFLKSIFNNAWSIRPDQENTIVVYGSASTVVLSVAVLLVSLIASLI